MVRSFDFETLVAVPVACAMNYQPFDQVISWPSRTLEPIYISTHRWLSGKQSNWLEE
jgi:hypothetical protein